MGIINWKMDWVRQLEHRCTQTIEEIVEEQVKRGATVIYTDDGPMVHLNQGSTVLGVCHMDYVHVPYMFRLEKRRKRIWTPRLDDRLGLWILLDVLPTIGINLDLLLTDSEEVGASTAEHYKPVEHKYNWLAQFDRRGDDVVTYDYTEANWKKAIRDNGFTPGHGSFSDISKLGHLKVCAMNIGIGYHNEHTSNCHVNFEETTRNIQLFKEFYFEHKDRKFDHTPVVYNRGGYGYNYEGDQWGDWQQRGGGYVYSPKNSTGSTYYPPKTVYIPMSNRERRKNAREATAYQQWLESHAPLNAPERRALNKPSTVGRSELFPDFHRHPQGFWPRGEVRREQLRAEMDTERLSRLWADYKDCEVCTFKTPIEEIDEEGMCIGCAAHYRKMLED